MKLGTIDLRPGFVTSRWRDNHRYFLICISLRSKTVFSSNESQPPIYQVVEILSVWGVRSYNERLIAQCVLYFFQKEVTMQTLLQSFLGDITMVLSMKETTKIFAASTMQQAILYFKAFRACSSFFLNA